MRYVRKISICLSISLFSALLTYLLLQSPPQPETQHTPPSPFALGIPVERFPILPRFEVPRHYGYFIGDQIPLKLVIETTGDVIVNLAKLPQKGQKHGPFEISDMQISQQAAPSQGTVYQVMYVLQYFGATPMSAVFKGVEILYANSTDRYTSSQPFTYKRLLTQPVSINVSRLIPFNLTDPRSHKAAVGDKKTLLTWLSGIFTLLCLLASGVLGSKAINQKVGALHTSKTGPSEPEKEDLHVPLVVVGTPSPTTRQQDEGDPVLPRVPTLHDGLQKVKTP